MTCPFFSKFPDGWYEIKTRRYPHTYVRIEGGLVIVWVGGDFGIEPFLLEKNPEQIVRIAHKHKGTGSNYPRLSLGKPEGWSRRAFEYGSDAWPFDEMIRLDQVDEWADELELL